MRLDRRHRHLGSSARDQGGKDNPEWFFLTGIGFASEHESEGASQIWGFVSDLLKDPKRLREGLEELIEREREEVQGDPDREAKAWANKLAGADDKRSRLQDMAAEGLITFDELGAKLEALEEERERAQRELEGLEDHRARLRDLERDKDTLLDHYAGILPETLDDLAAEERHYVYKLLKLRVNMHPHRMLEVSGMLAEDLGLCKSEPSSG